MKIRLEVAAASGASFPFERDGSTLVIGRDPSCELPLGTAAGDAVSWRHARIDLTPAGAYLSDLGSTNGTFVDTRRVTGRIALREGSHIRLGHTGPTLRVAGIDLSLPAAPLPRQQVVATALPVAAARPEPITPVHAPMALPMPPPTPAAATSSPTRLMLLGMRRRQRTTLVSAAIIISGLFALLGAVCWAESDRIARAFGRIDAAAADANRAADATRADILNIRDRIPADGREVYKRALHSTAWVWFPTGGIQYATGTGTLIDRKRRLLLTAYHVTATKEDGWVYFPRYKDGNPITDRHYYENSVARIPAHVAAKDSLTDLAILRLESVPDEVQDLTLASASPEPGSRVHTVGNPGISLGLWAYTSGSVRQVARGKYSAEGQEIDAWVVETLNPINHGDSGGPVVNDNAELVAVNSSIGLNIREGTQCIDIREVKTLLSKVAP